MYRLMFAMLLASATGCVPSVMVATQRDTAYQLDKRLPLYLELGADIGISEKNIYNVLQSSLERSGFTVVNGIEQARLVMSFRLSDTQYYFQTYDPYPFDFYPRRYLRYGWYQHYPRTYVREQKSIKLRLFDADTFTEGKRIPLWEGEITGDSTTVQDRLREGLGFLVNKIGDDYEGRVRLQ